MDELEIRVRKNLNCFCETLPIHVAKWREALTEVERPGRALSNYAEQLRHVERVNIKNLDGFEDLKQQLLHKIYTEIEDEISLLKQHINQLNQSNHELKNKLSLLERSTIDLDWERDSPLIRGTPLQPPLARVLQLAYEFWMFFSTAADSINRNISNLDVRNEKYMKGVEQSLEVNLGSTEVVNLMALVQYMDNEKGLV